MGGSSVESVPGSVTVTSDLAPRREARERRETQFLSDNTFRNVSVARVMAPRAALVSARALSMTKSWMMAWKRSAVTGTPASRSLSAYASPSSRSTSASPVMTRAGGRPASCSRLARRGGGGGLGPLGGVGGVLVPVPLHAVAAQVVAGGELVVGLGVEVGVGDRVEEHLLAERRTAALLGQQRDCGAHVPADAVAGDRDAAAVQSTLLPVL